MATSTSWAQDVIICDLCEKPTQQFCNSCQLSLCETCVKKHKDASLLHEIVPFLERIVIPECKENSSPSPDVSHLTTGIGNLMDEVRVITTISTIYGHLWGLVCVKEEEAWICGIDQTITRINILGTVNGTFITQGRHMPDYISSTRAGELIYSDSKSRTVNLVRHVKTETLITTPQDWTPGRACCTKSGDILVHVYKGYSPQTKNKIIRYHGQKIIQEINKDSQRNHIFKNGGESLFMSENKNGDVCVSDLNAGTVVAVDERRRVRFRYNGKPAKGKESFGPTGIVTDAFSQIIVSDRNNDCLHILDQNGQFQRCVDNCELDKPVELSVDGAGRLWVGLRYTGKIKVLEYLKTSRIQ